MIANFPGPSKVTDPGPYTRHSLYNPSSPFMARQTIPGEKQTIHRTLPRNHYRWP